MVASEAVNVEQEMESQAAILAASSSTQLKWAPIVMLGPLLPTMLAVVTIVVGEFVVKVRHSLLSFLLRFILWAIFNRRLVLRCFFF